VEQRKEQPETRWEALKEIMDNRRCREAIAFAWPLYFYTIFHGDRQNRLVTSYPELERKLNAPPSTIKRWKERLVEREVAESIQGNHQWTLRLLPPFDSPLSCLKTDHTEILIKSDETMKKMMKRLFSSDSVSLMPLIAELVQKVERLEQTRS